MRILVFVFTLMHFTAAAQTVPSSLINSGGGVQGTNVKLVTSIGESVVGKVGTGGIFLKQGFLIPEYSGQSSGSVQSGFSIYPNPAGMILNVRSAGERVEHCAVFNMLGQRVAIFQLSGSEVAIGKLPPGLYILTLMNTRKARLATFSLIKK